MNEKIKSILLGILLLASIVLLYAANHAADRVL